MACCLCRCQTPTLPLRRAGLPVMQGCAWVGGLVCGEACMHKFMGCSREPGLKDVGLVLWNLNLSASL